MAKQENRFEVTFVQKITLGSSIEVWVDKETGVNYIYRRDGYSGGLTVLLDAEGKPVVSKV
jgi:hypothetical protein